MIQDNLIIQLLSKGLSWHDSLSAREQARLLNNGEAVRWKEDVLAAAQTLGIPKALRQVAFSFRDVQAWGVYMDAVLDLFGIKELQGLACNPAELVERVATEEPKTWAEVRDVAIKIATEYLKQQIEDGDVYLLQPSNLTDPELSKHVPAIIEARKKQLEDARPYLRDDGFVDMFDFLELPITLELMLESGVGGRATQDKAKDVLQRLADLGLTSDVEPKEKRAIKRSVEEQYLRLYQTFNTNHTELLRGAAMSYDPEDEICKRGIRLIYASGHAHTLKPLLYGLERQDLEIVELSLQGLGILGNRDAVEDVARALDGNPIDEIKIAACDALGKLQGEKHLHRIVNLVPSRNDKVGLAAMKALLAINSQESMQNFWQQIPRFGMPKLANIAKDIADTHNEDAIIFLMGVLLLDLQAFLYTSEVHFYNAFMQMKDDTQKAVMMTVIKMFRGHGVQGFGRLGDTAVPVLVSLLKIFPETQRLFRDKQIWEPSERSLEKRVEARIREYFRLPRAEVIPNPVLETIEALGVTHSVRAIPFLEEIAKLDNEELVSKAMEALSEIDIPAIDSILKIDAKSKELKEQKLRDLGTIVHPKVTDWLIKQLDDKEPLLRMQAADFLAMRNDPSLEKHLMKAAKDKDTGVRAGLANILIRLGMDTYPQVMKQLSEDKDESIRRIIMRAQLVYQTEQDGDFWA